MDSKVFTARLAKTSRLDQHTVTKLLDSFGEILKTHSCDLDSILIPKFGNFVSMKTPERIVEDPATGKRMIMPPTITLEFVPSAMLKYRVNNE